MTEDEIIGGRHQLNGHEFEQIPGDSEEHGSLVCYCPWHHKESDKTEQLNKSKTLHRAGRLPCSGSHKEENLLTVSSDPVRPHLGNKLN